MKDEHRHKMGIYKPPSDDIFDMYSTTYSTRHGKASTTVPNPRAFVRPATTGAMGSSGYMTGHATRAVALGSTLHDIQTHTERRAEPYNISTARSTYVAPPVTQPRTNQCETIDKFYQPGGFVGNNKFQGTIDRKSIPISTYKSHHDHTASNTFPATRGGLGIPVNEVDRYKPQSGYALGHTFHAHNQLPYVIPHPSNHHKTTTREVDLSVMRGPINYRFNSYSPQKKNFAYTKAVLPPPCHGVGDRLREKDNVGDTTTRSVHNHDAANTFPRSRDATGIPKLDVARARGFSGFTNNNASLAFHQLHPAVKHSPMRTTQRDLHPFIDESKLIGGSVHDNVTQHKSGYGRLHGPAPVPQQEHSQTDRTFTNRGIANPLDTVHSSVQRTLALKDSLSFKNHGQAVLANY